MDVEAPELNNKDWTRTFEAINEWLRGCLGEFSKIPLAYVVQDNEAVTADPVAPATWPSKVDEMIGRAPHSEDTFFPVDNVTVWEKISALTRSHECWTYVQPTQCTCNGRMAYRALKNHYLGPNNTNHQTNEAEAKLKDSSYHGEKRHWNFEKYVRMHQDQHMILQSLVQHGYAGIDEHSKVSHLLDSIKTNELDTAKGQIWASPLLQNNFDDCVMLFRTSSTTRGLPPCGPLPLHPSGPNRSQMTLMNMTLNPTCQWMTGTTQAGSMPSCPRPRSLA